jgi:arginase
VLGLIGVPSSAGAFAPGQEQAPRALRDAGLVAALGAIGLAAVDHGDTPVWRWRPDRANPFAQNLDAVVATVQETATKVRAVLAAGQVPLVLGGDCTVELGTIAGHLPSDERIGLLYFDLHPDLNLPAKPGPGALDWTGMAHLLFAYGPDQSTPHELEAIGRLGLHGIPAPDVARAPVASAETALAWIESRCDRLLIHFDVDTIDFTDLPLSEETGRNQGLSFVDAMRALRVFLGSPRLSALTVTELNPAHGEEDGVTIRTFVEALVDALGSAPILAR